MSKDLTSYSSFEIVEGPNGAAPGPSTLQPGYPAPFPEEETGGVNLGRSLAAILRYRWWIIAFTLVGTVAGVGASRFVPSEYEAQATIWVETTSRAAEQAGPIRSEELLRSSSWIELLRSFIVLDPVVREERIYLTPRDPADSSVLAGLTLASRFVPGSYRLQVDGALGTYALESTGGGGIVERGEFGDSVGRAIGLRWAPDLKVLDSDHDVEFTVRPPREVAQELAPLLQATLDVNGNFLRVKLRGEDPARTATILNQVTERYVDVAAELKRARVEELVAILDEQLQISEQSLRESEIALEGFRVETITLPADRSTPVTPGLEATRDPVFANFFDMRVELEQNRRSQDAIRRAIAQTEDQGVALQTLEAINAVQQSSELTAAIAELTAMKAELRALLYRYTPEHPPVRQLSEDIRVLERTTIPALASVLVSELEARERQLEQRLAGASSELRQIPPRMIEEARLTRAVAIADNLYTTLQRRYEEARLAAVSSVPDVRILDPAVTPSQPVGDPKILLALFAFAGSLGLGIGGAVLRDITDRRLRYPEQVTRDMGLAVLGAIPGLKIRRGLLDQENRSQAEEAFRSLRLNLLHAHGTSGPIVLTVTSPGPGDGKSFVAANLALSYAKLGKRTVVVDGDIRRGTLHHLLGTERVPGLTEHLRDPRRELAVLDTGHDNLWLIPSGSRMQDGPELLSSRPMRELMQRLRTEFDVVLVDSPPLGAGVDPFALGTLTGAVMLVLRTGTTDRELADSKLQLLDRLPIRLLGAVLNGVPATREYKYYSYTSGYAAYDESERDSSLTLPASDVKRS